MLIYMYVHIKTLQTPRCSRDKALVMTIPANVVRNFNLTKGHQLNITYQDAKLIIDLLSGSQKVTAPDAVVRQNAT